MKFFFYLIVISILLTACQPAQDDRVKAPESDTQSETEKRSTLEYSISKNSSAVDPDFLEKAKAGQDFYQSQLADLLTKMNETVVREKGTLDRLKELNLQQPNEERQAQIAVIEQRAQQFEIFIPKLEKEISLTHESRSFDFQNSPEGVLQYVFDAAKNRDFSNLRYLLDPFGETVLNARQICYLDMSTPEKQEDLAKRLEHGKIIGKPILVDDKAEFKYTTGLPSSEPIIIVLIRRNNNWYLLQ